MPYPFSTRPDSLLPEPIAWQATHYLIIRSCAFLVFVEKARLFEPAAGLALDDVREFANQRWGDFLEEYR
jgi:hypothetical protein